MNLKTAIDLFQGQQRPTTRKSYEYVLNHMMNFVGPERPIQLVSKVQMLEYTHAVRERNLAPATTHKYIKTIKTFFNWVVKLGYLDESPANAVRNVNLQASIGRDKAITDDELAKVLDYVKWKPRDLALILFVADSGCRRSGAAGLRMKDLHLAEQRAYVTEKGDKTRMVAFGDECRKALQRWLDIRVGDLGDYVFQRRGQSIRPEAVSQIFRRACLEVGVRSLGAHALRHRKGHQFADARVAPSIAALALGHSDPTITLKHYYPADWGSAEKEIRRLSTQLPKLYIETMSQ